MITVLEVSISIMIASLPMLFYTYLNEKETGAELGLFGFYTISILRKYNIKWCKK